MLAEHARMVEENHNLIYGFLRKYKLGEDFYGDAAIGLCKAAESYDESKGVSFATYAYKCMFNECGITIRTEKRRIQTISLDTPVNEDETINLEAVLPSDFADINMESIPYIRWFLDKMCLVDLKILLYRLQGDSYRNVAKKIGYSYQFVKNRLSKMGEVYKSKKCLHTKSNTDDFFERQNITNEIFAALMKA